MKQSTKQYTVVTDRREQLPYGFPNSVPGTLSAGDYSLLGHETEITIERKSLNDLFGTVGAGRARFERELAKLAGYKYAAIVIEGDLAGMFDCPPSHSQMTPQSVAASLIAWSIRFNVHVWFASSRAYGYAVTKHILDKFWKEANARAAT